MKIKDYLENLPVGEVVNKRALSYFKRLGYIWDYSPWGYLESLHIIGKKPEGQWYSDDLHLEISPKRNCKGADERDHSEMDFDALLDFYGTQGRFEWNGITFRPKYFDGCFKPYLVKDGPSNGRYVNHRFAFPGGVC